MIPFGNWLFPFFLSLRVLDAGSFAKQLQQLVTGLELTTDRGSAWGQLVSAAPAPPPLPPSNNFRPRTNHCHSLSLPLFLPWRRTSSATASWGVKGVEADGLVLTCRMLTIRQKTLIGFNWKSIMGLIAAPRCHPRMAPVIWGLHLVADHAVKYLSDWRVYGA